MESSDGSNRVALFERMARRFNLRFPVLFGIFALLTLVDLAVPDFIPFVDEAGLAFKVRIPAHGQWATELRVPALMFW